MQAEVFVNPTLDTTFWGASVTMTPVLTVSLNPKSNSSEALVVSQSLG